MTAFTYEEQGDRKYLVYEKKPEDILDTLTLEMISNNKIDGLVPANHVQMDDNFYMKYDITGCKCLREYLQGTVNRQQLLHIMEAIADTVMEAEDYMLKLSSYVLDAGYMYIDGTAGKIFIVVLPITREEIPLETFLKELLMGAKYDQAEDCSYVAALISFFSSCDSFSAHSLKEQIARLKQEKKKRKPKSIPSSEVKKQNHEKQGVSHVNHKTSNDPEKQNCLDILFSNEEEKSLREKIGSFFKREKPEMEEDEEENEEENQEENEEEEEEEEKKGFFRKRFEKKRKSREKAYDPDPALRGIAIPGMEMLPGHPQEKIQDGDEEIAAVHRKSKKQEIPIPAQKIKMKQMTAAEGDFTDEEYFQEEDDEETAFLGQVGSDEPEFTLYRFSTGETFKISGDVVRIGRSPSIAEICITGNKCVGRIHAFLYVRGGKVYIEDNHSKNNTYVDGKRLEPRDSAIQLTDGSKIRLGNEELEFCIEE